MKRILMAAVIVAAIGTMGIDPVLAQGQMPMGPGGSTGQGPMGPGMMGPGQIGHGRGRVALDERPLISIMLRMRQQLGLSDEQVAKLTTLRSNFQKEAIRAEAEIRVLEVELDDLLDQSKVDLGRVEAAFRKEESLRVGLRLSRVKAIEAAKAILTAEQSDRLRKALESGLGMGPGMMGPGMMGPGGSGQGMMMGPQMMQQMMGGAMGQQAAAGTSASPGGEAAWKRTDATGPVTVEATLLDPGKAGDRIRVEIVLDTHSADLDGYRLESLAALRTDTGKTLQPLGVESPSGSGHHRKGILVFPARDTNGPVLAGAKALDLVVRDVGGVKERTLRWALP